MLKESGKKQNSTALGYDHKILNFLNYKGTLEAI